MLENGKFEPCASCGRRSYVSLELVSGRFLTYCYHHYTEKADNLLLAGAVVREDVREVLLA